MNMDALKYPIGNYKVPETYSSEVINGWINTIAEFPETISSLTKSLTSEQLSWHYRPHGWTIRQVVHHCADSHLNSFIRFKWSLTEDSPVIKAYFEDRWAELPDANNDNIQDSLMLLQGLHARWTRLLRNLSMEQLASTFTHPESGKRISLKQNISLYAWHCEHHLVHIRQAIQRKGIN